MELVNPLERRRVTLLRQPKRVRFRHLSVFVSRRSGHNTRRGAPVLPMRRLLQKLYLDVPTAHRLAINSPTHPIAPHKSGECWTA